MAEQARGPFTISTPNSSSNPALKVSTAKALWDSHDPYERKPRYAWYSASCSLNASTVVMPLRRPGDLADAETEKGIRVVYELLDSNRVP